MYPVSVKYDCQILKKSNHRYCPLSRHCWIKLTWSNALEHTVHNCQSQWTRSVTTFCSKWCDILDLATYITFLTCAFLTFILISPFVILPKSVTYPWNSDLFTFDDHTISSLQGSSLILTSHNSCDSDVWATSKYFIIWWLMGTARMVLQCASNMSFFSWMISCDILNIYSGLNF